MLRPRDATPLPAPFCLPTGPLFRGRHRCVQQDAGHSRLHGWVHCMGRHIRSWLPAPLFGPGLGMVHAVPNNTLLALE